MLKESASMGRGGLVGPQCSRNLHDEDEWRTTLRTISGASLKLIFKRALGELKN